MLAHSRLFIPNIIGPPSVVAVQAVHRGIIAALFVAPIVSIGFGRLMFLAVQLRRRTSEILLTLLRDE